MDHRHQHHKIRSTIFPSDDEHTGADDSWNEDDRNATTGMIETGAKAHDIGTIVAARVPGRQRDKPVWPLIEP
jgi:hypothetical protein